MATSTLSDVSLFTIGHSTRSIEEFVELLQQAEVEFVVDVRAYPRSRTNPQYNIDSFEKSLNAFGIEYIHIEELGGRRRSTAGVDPDINAYWESRSFHNYADYALSEEFAEGICQLLGLVYVYRCAIMCSEAVWWRCHRRIITDHMLALGIGVYHLMGKDRIEAAQPTSGAKENRLGQVTYPGRL